MKKGKDLCKGKFKIELKKLKETLGDRMLIGWQN